MLNLKVESIVSRLKSIAPLFYPHLTTEIRIGSRRSQMVWKISISFHILVEVV